MMRAIAAAGLTVISSSGGSSSTAMGSVPAEVDTPASWQADLKLMQRTQRALQKFQPLRT